MMIDIGAKPKTARSATARAFVAMAPPTRDAILQGAVPKGNVFEAARIAALLAAKRVPDLIPHCHPIALVGMEVACSFAPDGVQIVVTVRAEDRTGAEMEALTAAAIAALTVYDMCKATDPAMVIRDVCLLEKSGGKSGHWSANRSS